MNGHSNIDPLEATEHLKNILNVGKSETDTSKVKFASNGDMESAEDSNLGLDQPYQRIELNADKDSSHHAVYGNEVDVYSSPLVYGATCSQIIVDNVVNFGWEEKFYPGKLISIHMSGKYLAYVLKPSNNKPGIVRVMNLRPLMRVLIKNYRSEVKDIAFAHTSQILLGSVDAYGELFVHQVNEDDNELICNLLLHIPRSDFKLTEYNRIIWCLYIPDDSEDDLTEEDISSLLVVTHNERAEIWNIQTVIKEHGAGHITIDDVNCGVQIISEHKSPISTATFSPDGTALAIGSIDGVVKFFQVNTLDKDISPRCLHQWTPHGDKSLSSLYFLDNHKNHKPDIQFWKFAVTGAENNSEIKVWSCESWACLQTIRFHSNPGDCVFPSLKAEMDLSAKYLILSDIKRKVILIFLIQQDPLASTAAIKSISEFRVPLPVLSLAITSVDSNKLPSLGEELRNSDDEDECEQIGDTPMECENNQNKLIAKLFWIQTKSLQSCKIAFNPIVESSVRSVGSISSLSQDSYGFKDGLSDISMDAKDSSNRSIRDMDISIQNSLCIDKLPAPSQSVTTNLTSHINLSSCTEVLLTPDDFTSPSHSNLNSQSSYVHHEESPNSTSKCESLKRLSDGIDSLPVEPSTMQRRKSSQHSATSSPGREVAEIMAPVKGLPLDEILLETSDMTMKEDIESLENNLVTFNISPTVEIDTSINQTDFKIKEWPQAPDPNKEYGMSNLNNSDITNPSKCFAPQEEKLTSQINAESNKLMHQLNEKFEEMMSKIETLSHLSTNQHMEIQSLQTEIKVLQDQTHNQLKTNINNKLDHTISQHLAPSYSRIENLIVKSFEEEQVRTERSLAVISNDLTTNFGSKLEIAVKKELASSISPQMERSLETISQKVQSDLSQKLGTIDSSIKETLIKHLKGKAFVDNLAQSLSSSLQNSIQSACKEVFQSSVIPAFEKSCQNLFHQLNELFKKGTLDYIQLLEKNNSSSCNLLETIATQLKEEILKLGSTQQSIRSYTAQIDNRNAEILKKHEILSSNLRHIVHEEVLRAFSDQTSALNSRAVTPVPHGNDPALIKQQLMQQVKSGNLDEAFQQALSAMDVQLVLFLCEHVNVELIFGVETCPLQQHVLLSLVNQLSADFTVKTEIKVKYIEEVIATLDVNDRIVRPHIKNVLENLKDRITVFLQKNPSHKFARCMKRTSLAIQALIN